MAFHILVGELEYIWELGDEKPYPDEEPTYLRAEGKELEYIRSQFENIPMRLFVNEVTWHNEMALFIYDNL